MPIKFKHFLLFLGVIALSFGFASTGHASGQTLGGLIMNVIGQGTGMIGLLSGLSYLAGLILGIMGIFKLKEHVESPERHPIWEPIKRFAAGGLFFALPIVIDAVVNTIDGAANYGDGYSASAFTGSASAGGLDAMIVRLMVDVMLPLQFIFGWFGYIAGIILVMVGIGRLLKGEQEGPRGPAGIGTLVTFLVAGCLFSLNNVIGALVGSVFANSTITAGAALKYTAGLSGAEAHVHAVISAIIAFSLLLGWVSILKGLFQLKGVADGNQQSSVMSAVTHLIGGALAVNLGGIINAVQATLGIVSYGIQFS
jgi:hypothetical protein